ncbi:Uncharacterised protein [Mycobacteroides abscessus subsp. abscessus]|uniref:hypothetical protein n=1 Tax=Mycobacteroides abscessus TaxID=36809 RepID=UPI0009262A2F|nr:hypothetical protein [Mycobacteroides abscessus]SIL73331.1 Uncharacterised protein [Mycobacteroides abscessus subsp. abscessus]
MSVNTLEFPKLPKWHKWTVRYSPTLGMPMLHVRIKFLGVFTAESSSGSFDYDDPDITPERLRNCAIRLARFAYGDFQRGRGVGVLYEAAASVARDLNSGDAKKVSN